MVTATLGCRERSSFCVIALHHRGDHSASLDPPNDNAAEIRGVATRTNSRIELLRYRLLEHAIDLLVRRITAGLAGLGSLQSLIRCTLCAVSCRLCRLSGARGGISSSLRSSGVLDSLVCGGLDLVNRLLRNATARSEEGESGDACLQGCGDGVLHSFFPLQYWVGQIRTSEKYRLLIRGTYGLFPWISPRIPFICKRC
jgi:hypothetical protein